MHPSISKKFYFEDKSLNALLFLFLIAGLGTRLFHFFYNRSLWMDEVYLSSSIINMNFSELVTKPLYYQQKAPIGFLIAVKFIVSIFKNSEIYLRLIPLITGILSMFLFIPVAKYFLKNYAAVLAVGIICLAPAIIYHSVEIKQYSTELLGTVLSFYLFIQFKDKKNMLAMIYWGFSGAVILWFSYSSIFILAGIGTGLSLNYILKKQWNTFFISIIPFLLWLISFIVNFLLFTHKHAESAWIAYWFRAYNNFMPFPPKSISDLKWFAISLYRMMDYLGLLWSFKFTGLNEGLKIILKMPFIPIAFFIIGMYSFFKEKKVFFSVLILPIILMFLASGLELYPLTERFWLFISPIFLIVISKGFEVITTKYRSKILVYTLFFFSIAPATIQSISYLLKPVSFFSHKKSFQREVLMYVNRNYSPHDGVYIYWNNLAGYKLYKRMYNLKYTAIEGTDQRKNSTDFKSYYANLQQDFDKFSAKKRVWLVYNTQFLTDIGDLIDEPIWYYKNSNQTLNLTKEFLKKYYIDKKIQTKDVTAVLFIRRE